MTVLAVANRYGYTKSCASKVLSRIETGLNCRRQRFGRLLLFPETVVAAAERAVADHFAGRPPPIRYKPRSKPSRSDHDDTASASQRPGEYYILQMDPEARPNRLKMGFTGDLEERLLQFKSICPDLKVLRHYPHRMCVEVWARRFITHGLKQVAREVFDVPDVEAVLRDADAFFARVHPESR